MQIKTGEYPDIWFEPDDLTPDSLIAIRRESVTCCGFLGGDSILIIRSGEVFAEIISHFRPVLPWKDRLNHGSAHGDINESAKKIITSFINLDKISKTGPAGTIVQWQKLLHDMNETVWFAKSADPYKFQIDISGDIHTFLEDRVYSSRLITSLHWWYANEADPKEREQFVLLPLTDQLSYPKDHELIIKAINLYNHGAYEMARI
jgi:hypothetical protein